ncbi:MAG: GWxTD domain-containing protein [Bacteroidetes bacterium]|nr:GWxTD domain-containing protein [Bacteroidota bacterium]
MKSTKAKTCHENLKLLLFLLPLFLISITSCEPARRASNQNVAFLYKKEAPVFNPEYTVVHVNDSLSELLFKIPSNQVLYARPNSGMPFAAQVKVSYRVFDDFDAHIIYDTASIIMNDIENFDLLKDLVGNIRFRANQGMNYVLEVTMADINRNRSRKQFINVEKANNNSRHNFIAKDLETNIPAFGNLVKNKMSLQYAFPHREHLYIRYYNRDFGIAPPPFAMVSPRPFEYRADSVFMLHLENQKAILDFNQKGFYHIQVDTLMNRNGYTLFNFNSTFPEIKSVDEMISPLRYITSKSEHEAMANATNKKEALDQFWINAAGNPERARELISIFYNRVQDANLHFSSFIEGWKTDRGMIYIIFGPPNVLYKTSDTESWIYGEDQNMMSLTFNFMNIENPFTDNDYSLDRSVIYKNNWHRAVDTWRQGRVF